MDLEQLDALLRQYGEAEQKIAATLVDLESQPTYKLVAHGTLRGATKERLQEALAAVPELWRAFTTLREVLEEARTIRGTRRSVSGDERRKLESLLAEPSIVVRVDQLPIDERTLLGPSQTETRLTPEQLLTHMAAIFERVTDGVGAVERVWREHVPRIDAANEALTRLQGIAQSHGLATEPALDSLRDAVADVESMLAEDPLGIGATQTQHLDAALAIAEERIGKLTRGRAELDDDLTRAGELLVRLRRERAESAAAVAEARVKIADYRPSDPMPDLIDRADGLASELDAIGAIADWREKRRRLDAWLARAEPLAAESARRLRDDRAPMERRSELRGLLAAYRAKASDLGLIEDEQIAALLRAAQQELHTAPTSLDRAATLVTELASALARRPKDTR